MIHDFQNSVLDREESLDEENGGGDRNLETKEEEKLNLSIQYGYIPNGGEIVMTKTVTIRPMGSRAKKVSVSATTTVGAILKKANIDLSDKKVKIVANGTVLTQKSKLGKFKELLLIPTVKGGGESLPHSKAQKEKFDEKIKSIRLSYLKAEIGNLGFFNRDSLDYVVLYRRKLAEVEESIERRNKKVVKCTGEIKEVLKKHNDKKSVVFSNLHELPYIEQIKVWGKKIILKTKDVEFEYNGSIYNIGPYNIIFQTENERNIPNVVVRRVDYCLAGNVCHMFVGSGGGVCFGNDGTTSQVIEWMKEGRIDLVTTMIWETLTTWDEEASPYVSPNVIINKLRKLGKVMERKVKVMERKIGGDNDGSQ